MSFLVLMAAAVAASTTLASPAPSSAPVVIERPASYVASCDMRDKATSTAFSVNLKVSGVGKRRRIEIETSNTTLFPAGRFKAEPVVRIDGRHIDATEVALNGVSLGLSHHWHLDRDDSDLWLSYVRVNEAVRWPATGRCRVSLQGSKT